MKKTVFGILFAFCAFGLTGAATAADKSTPDQATALVKKAVAFLKANGKEKALAEFNNPKGQFVNGDLYIFALEPSGVTVANGNNGKLVGKNVLEMKDQDGKPFIKTLLEIGNTKGSGWLDYRWNNPVSSKIEMKSTYVEKSDDLYVACGIYK
ncbi:MAG: cache domain-containing protein [Pseudomonadota bacterium]